MKMSPAYEEILYFIPFHKCNGFDFFFAAYSTGVIPMEMNIFNSYSCLLPLIDY